MTDFRTEFIEHVEIETPDEERLLDLACATLDEIAAMRQQIERDGYTVTGSKAQIVAHPLLREIRAHQAEFGRLMKALAPDETPRARQAAAALANRRWKG